MTKAMDEARYGRLCVLTLRVCPETLRKVIDHSYRPTVSDFEAFLNRNIHALFHLRFRHCCCRPLRSNSNPMTKPQWDLLFTRVSTTNCHLAYTGDCPCQYKAKAGVSTDLLDTTFCCLFVTNLCPHIPQVDINIIRDVRNTVIHSSTAAFDALTFQAHWNRLENALLNLSNTVSPACNNDTRTTLQTLKNRVIDPAELEAFKTIMTDHRDYDSVKQVSVIFNLLL